MEQFSTQFMEAFRLLLSCLCGLVIGFERQNHLRAAHRKSAGLRTHMMVCLASAALMLISKYGFFDVLVYGDNVRVDVSRVAAAIVSGVGFLGAGIIYMRKESAVGLTTSAGLWATSAVGMAIGCGMYLVGAVVTILIVIIQMLSNNRLYKSLQESNSSVTVEANNVPGITQEIVAWVERQGIEVCGLSSSRDTKHGRRLTLQVDFKSADKRCLLRMMDELENVERVEY